jgi:DNA-binding transcriptional LysR family regulator
LLDFRHHTFLALCKIGSYTKTADHLHITQPAVTQHIKHLEKVYGGKLFSYDGKALTLTERGRLLYDFTTTMMTDSKRIKDIVLAVNHQAKTLAFGATRTIGEYIMPGIIANLMSRMPNLHLLMPVENTQILLEKLRDGEIAFAFLEGFFDKSHYDARLFSREEFIAICAPDSPFAGREVKFEELLNSRLVLREEGSGSLDILEHVLHERNLTRDSFQSIIEIGNIPAIKQLVANGVGISFLYKAAVLDELASGRLAAINIRDLSVSREFNFVFLKDSIHSREYLDWFEIFRAAR